MTTALRSAALALLLSSPSVVLSQSAGFSNSPYTATLKTTSVQRLVDGTTITRETTVQVARDSQGRTMRQQKPIGLPQPAARGLNSTTVTDPVAHTTTMWSTGTKVATTFHMPENPRIPAPSGVPSLGSGSGVMSSVVTSSNVVMTTAGVSGAVIDSSPLDPNLRPSRQTEKLGSKTIAGVYAEGTRVTTTYPVGSLGNDRPIVTVRETWTSPDLRLVVLSTDEDPRTGKQTTEVINLDHGEPDPALFQVPEGYTIRDQTPGSN